MDLIDHLKLFVEIADNGSMSAVARIRAVSPSTVTLGLQRLEQRVGVQLVTRSTRQLSLTAEGERFLADSRRLLAELDEAMDRLSERSGISGPLRITSTNDFGRERLAPLVSDFMAYHPDIRLELHFSDAVVNLMEQGMDIGIRTGPLEDSRLKARLLIQGTRQVVASPGYWRQHGKPSHPSDLEQHNCMYLQRPGSPQSTWRFHDGKRALAIKVNGDRSANDGGTLRRWAIHGAGVVLKSSWDIAGDVARGRLEPVLEEFTDEPINLYAVYSAGRLPRRVQVFLDFLRQRLKESADPA